MLGQCGGCGAMYRLSVCVGAHERGPLNIRYQCGDCGAVYWCRVCVGAHERGPLNIR